MGYIKQIIAAELIACAAEKVEESGIIEKVSDGVSNIADSIDEKRRNKIRKAATRFKNQNTLCAFLESRDQYDSLSGFIDQYWSEYKYSVYDNSETVLFEITLDKMICTIKDLRNPSHTLYVKCFIKGFEKKKFYDVYENNTLVDRISSEPTLLESIVKDNFGVPLRKSDFEYRFDHMDWILKETTMPHSAILESASRGTVASIKYSSGGFALGYNNKKSTIPILVAAFIPLIEKSQIYKSVSGGE